MSPNPQNFARFMFKRFLAANEAGHVIGEDHHRAKLTDGDVDLILELRFTWKLTYPAIAAKFDDVPGGISRSTVRDICLGRRRGQVAHSFKPKR